MEGRKEDVYGDHNFVGEALLLLVLVALFVSVFATW